MSGTLAVDVSNLHTGLAYWPEEGVVRHWQIASLPSRTPDEYRVLVARLLRSEGLATADVSECVLGCVVPELAPVFDTLLCVLFGKPPVVVGPGTRTGLDIRTDDPREVGADRIANAVAASERYGCPVIVLDFGTALTIDVVAPDGAYLGAVIAPGIEVAAEALARRAARLGRIELRPPPAAVARNTEHGLQSGLVLGYIGLVEGLVDRVRAEVGPARVVATGDGPWLPGLLALCPVVEVYEPLLTLDGLRRILVRQPRRP